MYVPKVDPTSRPRDERVDDAVVITSYNPTRHSSSLVSTKLLSYQATNFQFFSRSLLFIHHTCSLHTIHIIHDMHHQASAAYRSVAPSLPSHLTVPTDPSYPYPVYNHTQRFCLDPSYSLRGSTYGAGLTSMLEESPLFGLDN